MGKISPVSAKYIIHASIDIDGVVSKPDVIGAVFGQTEGLLGNDLELRELQRSGRIGRIEVTVETSAGKTHGSIIIPSSLDKAETCIIAAALEVIERIGPCSARIRITNIEDVRITKRNQVIERAKNLLRALTNQVLPDSQELTDEVTSAVRVMEVKEYGKDRLTAGPAIDESDEIIVVEGRADVLNLLKHGIKNAIALNGTSVPETIKELSKRKIVTVFVDGDRGGELILRELMAVADIDYVVRAPDGKEVEEITKKEILKALRNRISVEQAKHELNGSNHFKHRVIIAKKPKLSDSERNKFKVMLEDLIGTRGAYLLDKNLDVLGKVPISELATTIRSLKNTVYAVILDGLVDNRLARIAEQAEVTHLIAMSTKIKQMDTKTNIITIRDLQ